MSNDINFLKARSETKKRKKGLKAIRLTAIFSLIIVVLFSAFAYYLNGKIYPKSLKNERDSLLQSLSILRNREAKRAMVANRIENISELLNKRVGYAKIVSRFSEKIPSGIRVDSLKIDKKTVIIAVSSDSLLPINEFIDGLISLGQEKIISVLLLDSLSTSEGSGIYSVSLTANL